MALINPVYTLLVPFLFVVTVPLAVFAGITTTLAFSVLIVRVLIVYLDVAVSLVPQYFASPKRYGRHGPSYAYALRDEQRRPVSPAASSRTHSTDSNTVATPPQQQQQQQQQQHQQQQQQQQQQPLYRRRRRRPSSATSVVSAGSATPVGEMALSLMPSVGPDRDFEGVGGWRSGRDGDDETWMAINSRFEFPDRPYARGHHRSPSGGPVTPGDGGILMMKATRAWSPEAPSPNSSRTRTPSASRMSVVSLANSDGYFSLAMSPTASKKMVTHPF